MPDPTTARFVLFSLLGLVSLWLGYDLSILRLRGPDHTISHTITALSFQYPAIPFLTGLVLGLFLGHLFLSQRHLP